MEIILGVKAVQRVIIISLNDHRLQPDALDLTAGEYFEKQVDILCVRFDEHRFDQPAVRYGIPDEGLVIRPKRPGRTGLSTR